MRLTNLAACTSLVCLLLVSASAGPPPKGRPLEATLSGDAEVPPVDSGGSGWVRVTVSPGQAVVCWELQVTGIAPATAAHIHHAPAGLNGAVVVTLTPPTDGEASGCVDVEGDLARDIASHPDQYYVNVHNAEYPPGAVRGQLSPPGRGP